MDTETMRKLEARAGTGFMKSLSEAMSEFRSRGYAENFVLKGDGLECQNGRLHVDADDFVVDEVERFDESSDPADQSILYAISIPHRGLKGLVVESYGTYSPEISKRVIDRLREHLAHQ